MFSTGATAQSAKDFGSVFGCLKDSYRDKNSSYKKGMGYCSYPEDNHRAEATGEYNAPHPSKKLHYHMSRLHVRDIT